MRSALDLRGAPSFRGSMVCMVCKAPSTYLCKVASASTKAWVTVVVVLDLTIPHLYSLCSQRGLSEVHVMHLSQVLTIPAGSFRRRSTLQYPSFIDLLPRVF